MATEDAIHITSKEFLSLMYDRKWSLVLPYISPTSKLSDFEKKSLIMYQDSVGNTSLHLASRCQSKDADVGEDRKNGDVVDGGAAPWNLTKILLSIGGADLLSKKDKYGRTALHDACRHGAPSKLIKTYLQKGKEELLMEQDVAQGDTALHLLIDNMEKHSKPLEVIQLLTNKGGHKLKTILNGNNHTAFDLAVENGAQEDVKVLVKCSKSGCFCF